MPKPALPQLDRLFLTDSGLETDLIYHHGADLPHFAAFTLLGDIAGERLLSDYYRRHLAIAHTARTGFILESPTWRANPDWAERLGLTAVELDARNRRAIAMLLALRAEFASAELPIVVSGCIGPRGDGYRPGASGDSDTAAAYHRTQVESLAAAGADMLSALTMTTSSEATGVAMAARAISLPVAIAFTVETDARLPSGETIAAAITAVDAATTGYPAYFMINCAHVSHFATALPDDADWVQRIRGIRANASRCSHAELDAMTELDDGDPAEFGRDYRALTARLPQLTVLGGCCGSDHRHVAAIAMACGHPAAN